MLHLKIKKIIARVLAFSLAAILAMPTMFTPSVFATESEEITVTYPYYGFVEDPDDPWESVYDAMDETGEVQYSDAYFSEPSPGDHPKLRAVSYALALAGFENTRDGYSSDPTIINPKLYNLLDQMGFTDLWSFDFSSDEEGHSMGTTIGHKTLADGQDLIVIAPRNYNYMTEWLSNLDVGTSGDHDGFSEAAGLIVNRFNDYLDAHDFSDYKVWVVGYSRGGAVVDLFAKYINNNLADYDFSADDFYAYTFGAPKASVTETNFSNIHDVKDGNDLLLGYVFPEAWGFYNTGVYEEIHPADLKITQSLVDITRASNPETAFEVLANNESITEDIGQQNGREFMDSWVQFVNENGLTRDYFDTEVKPPLSEIMQAYQLRTIDKQSEFLNFFIDVEYGLANRVAGSAFSDLLSGAYGDGTFAERLANFPPYLDLVKIVKGTATDADIDEFLSFLDTYMGEYSDYQDTYGEHLVVSEEEFTIIKDNLPKLIKALAPIIVADAKYTQETYGSSYSLYYTYTLASNAKDLVVGHIPESIMPILKSLIPSDDPVDPEDSGPEASEDDEVIGLPNTGSKNSASSNDIESSPSSSATFSIITVIALSVILSAALLSRRIYKNHHVRR